LGYNENDYNTHSFNIGAATHAAKMGKSDDEINDKRMTRLCLAELINIDLTDHIKTN
jgi:hypothetical protein